MKHDEWWQWRRRARTCTSKSQNLCVSNIFCWVLYILLASFTVNAKKIHPQSPYHDSKSYTEPIKSHHESRAGNSLTTSTHPNSNQESTWSWGISTAADFPIATQSLGTNTAQVAERWSRSNSSRFETQKYRTWSYNQGRTIYNQGRAI